MIAFWLLWMIAWGWSFSWLLHHAAPRWNERVSIFLVSDLCLLAVLLIIKHSKEQLITKWLDRISKRIEKTPNTIWRALQASDEVKSIEAKRVAQAKDVNDRKRFDIESVAAFSWWRVELSGAHFIWWLSLLLCMILLSERWQAYEWLFSIVSPMAFIGFVIKGTLLFMMLNDRMSSNSEDVVSDCIRRVSMRNTIRQYRWWGRGWLPIILAILPALGWWALKHWFNLSFGL